MVWKQGIDNLALLCSAKLRKMREPPLFFFPFAGAVFIKTPPKIGTAKTPPISPLCCSFQSRNSPAASPSSYRRNPSCLKSLLTVYSPHLDSPPPRWVHLAHGLLLFLYQTFDAVDGKQARRTNSSSPLGELFDHGRDALASTFETMDFGSTAMCGGDSFWFWVILSIPFYGATWEHYFTNALILPIVNGPTEGLALIYGLHFMTAIVGAQWWAQPFQQSIPFLSWIPYVNELPTYKAAVYLLTPIAILPTVAC
ncbi:choline/ethanolaminephosphotransferase 1-like [Gossypium arboreum]|uniref:choline/ethanolaminephosphotransferase 1-like n=1 Tax=Gossypium arboreum TaxID=29729 RepID=UPI0022F19546|nr:choline/ethanolaminephosphotransferase 1-like [Gossypium arboreum]